jgi:hypothetical protein
MKRLKAYGFSLRTNLRALVSSFSVKVGLQGKFNKDKKVAGY